MEYIVKDLVKESGQGVSFCRKALNHFDTYNEALDFAKWAKDINTTEGAKFENVIKIYEESKSD